MKYFFLVKKTIPFLLVLLVFSCAPREASVYYQNIDTLAAQEKQNSYEIKIQPDDLLMIIVSADDPEIAVPFNLKSVSIVSPSRQDIARGQETTQLYFIDANGFIDFPILGKIKVGGLTRSEALLLFQQNNTSLKEHKI